MTPIGDMLSPRASDRGDGYNDPIPHWLWLFRRSEMQVQVHTDGKVQGREDVKERVRTMVTDGLARYADRLTRVEVHLSDENSSKAGADDKRCLMEARVAGMEPVVASHYASTVPVAIDGALDKLRRGLDSAIGRLESR